MFGHLEAGVFMLTLGIGSEKLVGRSCEGIGKGFPSPSPLLCACGLSKKGLNDNY